MFLFFFKMSFILNLHFFGGIFEWTYINILAEKGVNWQYYKEIFLLKL